MGTSSWGFSPTLRDIAARKEFEREQQANPGVNELADWYAGEHKRREQERAQREADEQRQTKERIAQIKADEKRRLRERVLSIMYSSYGASDSEIRCVDTLVRQNTPESFGNPDVHAVKLLELRSLIGS